MRAEIKKQNPSNTRLSKRELWIASSLALCLSIQEARAECTINGAGVCYGTSGVADTSPAFSPSLIFPDSQGFYQAKISDHGVESEQDLSLVFTNGKTVLTIAGSPYSPNMGGDITASRKPVIQLKITDKGLMIKNKMGKRGLCLLYLDQAIQ